MIRFLETITYFGDPILIPIDKIKFVKTIYKDKDYIIEIDGGEEFQLIEAFGDNIDKCDKRWEQIKKILNGENNVEVRSLVKKTKKAR